MKSMSKKIGRPNKLGKSTLRAFRLPDHEYSMVLQYAALHAISASEAIRQIIVQRLATPAYPLIN